MFSNKRLKEEVEVILGSKFGWADWGYRRKVLRYMKKPYDVDQKIVDCGGVSCYRKFRQKF